VGEEGKKLYQLYCSPCHGINGNGKGINYQALTIRPQDHTDASYLSVRTDKQLEDAIRLGGLGVSKSPLMPPWGEIIVEKDIKSLVKYLRTLCSCRFDAIVSDPKLRDVDLLFRE